MSDLIRILIKDVSQKAGQKVMLQGRVINVRSLGNVIFVLMQDYSGQIQTVWETKIKVKTGDLVEILGQPRFDERARGGWEIIGENIKIIATSCQDLPFDLSKKNLKLQLNTLFDWRVLSLRHPKIQAIFKLYALLLEAYAYTMRREGFTEIKTPKILGAASEGGANFFKIKYFDQNAFLAQSPQFYKQIMVGVFERVFEIGPVFRAEPHFTTRHVNEYISLDAEMGFIKDFSDVMKMLNKVLVEIFGFLLQEGQEYLAEWQAQVLPIPENIPTIKLKDIKEIIKKKYHYEIPDDTDIDPEGERLAGRWAKEEYNSDFVFLTHYPWEMRPFYTLPCADNTEETYSFDLIYKGVELVTGSQRIHNYQQLLENMKKKGVKPDGMEYYLEVFKFAMPPHGGWGMGSERLIQQLLNLSSVKEAILFPRDVKRLVP